MKEPKNFKGTPGEWGLVEHSWSDTSVVSGDYTVCTKSIDGDIDEDDDSEEQQEKLELIIQADFRLMCQSKRMLAAMQKSMDQGELPFGETYNEFKEIIKLALGE